MAPASLRLDTETLTRAERLEASRQSCLGSDEAAKDAVERIVHRGANALASECRNVYGDAGRPSRIVSEAQTTFLPRYLRLVLEQHQIQNRLCGFVAGDIVPRFATVPLGFLGAEILARRIPGGFGIALQSTDRGRPRLSV